MVLEGKLKNISLRRRINIRICPLTLRVYDWEKLFRLQHDTEKKDNRVTMFSKGRGQYTIDAFFWG